ncbi:MAG: efflux transporter periplasmic adaptor subunit [Gammaproteobacteria bacterium RIFCSPHIGHO2_12_FULL_41_15]|nr:MAG: efflux transporter periplasmic adaptor subunit [Gammaproteobacteria bacterium RIFCSPHIGHO2_12_FULL_41_15]
MRLFPKAKGKRKLIIMLSIFSILLIITIISRISSAMWLRYQVKEKVIRTVNTITAKHAPWEEEVILPGDLRAWHEAPIYARSSGYVKNWYVDIGYRVEKGQLLAEIETPELDAALRNAEAQLIAIEAKNKLAQSTADRWLDLLKTKSVSQQETDEKVDTATAIEAEVIAQEAKRDKLKELVGFGRVVAPFNGTITARRTDIGNLINAGSKPDEQEPLFRISQTDPLRLYVSIPQTYSSRLSAKMTVDLTFTEHPGQTFPAILIKTADGINPVTRTLLAEFQVNNAKNELLEGSYAQVHFRLPSYANSIVLPVNALLFRKEGLQVATVTQHNRIAIKSVTVSRDFGLQVQINSGIAQGTTIVLNPADAIMNGEKVRLKNG